MDDTTIIYSFRLRVFKEVASFLNFSHAAKKLGISQPAVSMNIREIEKILNEEVFVREPGSIHLTDAGRLLLDYVKSVEKLEDKFLLELSLLKNRLRGKIRIGICSQVRYSSVESMIEEFRRIYPEVEFMIISDTKEQIRKSLLYGFINVSFVNADAELMLDRDDFQTIPLYRLAHEAEIVYCNKEEDPLLNAFIQYAIIYWRTDSEDTIPLQ